MVKAEEGKDNRDVPSRSLVVPMMMELAQLGEEPAVLHFHGLSHGQKGQELTPLSGALRGSRPTSLCHSRPLAVWTGAPPLLALLGPGSVCYPTSAAFLTCPWKRSPEGPRTIAAVFLPAFVF